MNALLLRLDWAIGSSALLVKTGKQSTTLDTRQTPQRDQSRSGPS